MTQSRFARKQMRTADMRQCLTLVGLTILAVATLASACAARDIYVDNLRGDDHHAGRSPELGENSDGPCRSICKALRIACMGDRIVLKNNGIPYRESITFQSERHSGFYPGSPFILEGNGATLDGSALVPIDAWEVAGPDLYRFSPWRKAYNILFLDNKPLEKADVQSDADLAKMQPMQWALHEGYIYFKSEKDLGLGGYRLTYTGLTVGITLYDVRFVEIRGLTVQGFQLDGINAHDNAFEIDLNGITARGNGRSGISVGGASRVTIRDALVGNNGVAQVRTEGFCRVVISGSDLLDNTAPAIDRVGGTVIVDGQLYEPLPPAVQQASAEMPSDEEPTYSDWAQVNYLQQTLLHLDVITR
ncbi:right-handed parallel beta-helix repeat-containing protein [Blastopirellula sp. JC732]|uniref:Right-handed parallel beta-helix repeat-containing protein n=1 Tax=Blastopirellula sediminis TaxID=2894196 RepID=A0A9X1MNY0_9BACT|nr:right-handed parallel beta-helix repeat-containing protein [Blastopirellula sediminis]MCC9629362.1 right-handed parallel beta-helix repeat-containing protein [Blastopirellula sediminis]